MTRRPGTNGDDAGQDPGVEEDELFWSEERPARGRNAPDRPARVPSRRAALAASDDEAAEELPPTDEGASEDEIWDDDDDWGRSSGGGGTPSWLPVAAVVAGLVTVVLLVALVLVLRDDKEADTTASGDQGTNSQTSGPEGTTGTTVKAKPNWPNEVAGRPEPFGARDTPPPATADGTEPGVYLWSDFDGWHAWVVKGEGTDALRGTITFNDPPTRADLAVDGQGTASIAGNTITFDFAGTTAPVVGVDFGTGFFAGTLELAVEGPDGPVAGELVHLGSKQLPGANPYTATKEAR